MISITARNVNHALEEALWRLRACGVACSTRNGPVVMLPEPAVTCYTNPTERVMFSALRDANPFFHLMESIWMLGGNNDVAFPARYAKQIGAYSDDGLVLAGGYGYRWRQQFGPDQLCAIIELLRKDPTTRRAVLQMWDCTTDLAAAGAGGLDVPCNTHIYFSAVLGRLDMTVCCRSNDAVWGAYGANAVHFSMLQQFIAEAAGIPIGRYYQVSNNLHIYLERPDVQRLYASDGYTIAYTTDDRYSTRLLRAIPLIRPLMEFGETYEDFLADAADFLRDPDSTYSVYRTDFFTRTIIPAQIAHTAYKAGRFTDAEVAVGTIHAPDWRLACYEWLQRRRANAQQMYDLGDNGAD